MRIFLDANVLFSAARSSGAVRQLVVALHAAGHSLVADEYVAEEARRNVTAKASREAVDYLKALLGQLEVRAVQVQPISQADVQWLPAKDRPVLLAAIALKCDALVTGDRTHFGAGYEKVFEGVTVYSPAQLALAVFPPHATPT
jgi:predicted nucleic acid-binding protein